MSEVDSFPLSEELLIEIITFLISVNIGRYAVPDLTFLKKHRTSMAENYRAVVRFARTNKYIHNVISNHGLKVIYFHNQFKKDSLPRIHYLHKKFQLQTEHGVPKLSEEEVTVRAIRKYQPTHIISDSDTKITDTVLQRVADIPIVCLYTRDNMNITVDGLSTMQSLRYLYTYSARLTDAGYAGLTELRHLELYNNGGYVGDWGLIGLENLEKLVIQNADHVSDISLQRLVNLRYVKLHNCPRVTDIGVVALKNVEYISISGNRQLTDDAFVELHHLRFLRVDDNNNLTDTCLIDLPQLEIVSMNRNTKITDKGIQNERYLQYMCFVNNTNFTDDCVCNLSQLRTLILPKDTKLTGGAFKKLDMLEYLELPLNMNIKLGSIAHIHTLKHVNTHYVKSCQLKNFIYS